MSLRCEQILVCWAEASPTAGHSGKCVLVLTSLVAAGLVQLVGQQVRRHGATHVPVDIWVPAVAIAAQMMLLKIALWGGEQQASLQS